MLRARATIAHSRAPTIAKKRPMPNTNMKQISNDAGNRRNAPSTARPLGRVLTSEGVQPGEQRRDSRLRVWGRFVLQRHIALVAALDEHAGEPVPISWNASTALVAHLNL